LSYDNKPILRSIFNISEIVLRNTSFKHNQLYVIISRVQNNFGLKILIHDIKKKLLNSTKVVFQNVEYNLQQAFWFIMYI